MNTMPKKINLGDIIEIPTKDGLGYAQYTHRHEEYGELIRILDGVFQSRPSDFTDMVKRKYRFVTFFPLSVAVEAKAFPLLRAGNPLKDGKVDNWWLWDGSKSCRVGKLSAEQYKFPIQEFVDVAALVHIIE